MRIVVNHLTRMQPGFICVAGIDPATGQHVRPVLNRRLPRKLIERHGGPFEVGAMVELGATTPSGKPPEVEDHLFDQATAAKVGDMAGKKFWQLLTSVSTGTLRQIFGAHLQAQGGGCTVDLAHGIASLGCLRLATRPWIEVNGFDKIRLLLNDGAFNVDLSVTDLRLYEDDQKTPRRDVVDSVMARIRSGVDVILSVGLTRAWQKPGDSQRRHWLQVNNVHLADDPAWRLG